MKSLNKLLLATACAVSLTGCSSHGTSELGTWVGNYCGELELELQHAAELHRNNQGSAADLDVVSVGTSDGVRGARTHDFASRELFCITVRRLTSDQVTQLEQRLQSIRTGLYATTSDPLKTADLLDQWHSLAHEVNQAPLKQ